MKTWKLIRPACTVSLLAAAMLAVSWCFSSQAPPAPAASKIPPEIALFQHVGPVECLAFSPDGKYLVGGSFWADAGQGFFNGVVRVWDVKEKREVKSVRLPQRIRAVSFSPNGNLLAVACGTSGQNQDKDERFKRGQGELRLFSFPTLEESKTFLVSNIAQDVAVQFLTEIPRKLAQLPNEGFDRFTAWTPSSNSKRTHVSAGSMSIG